jgi:signal transduction histidine kinase
MTLPPKLHKPAYLAGTLLALALILLTESAIWKSVNDLRQRSESINSDAFHVSEHLEVQLRELNEGALLYSLEPSGQPQSGVAQKRQAMEASLARSRSLPIDAAQREALLKFEAKFEIYSQHLEPVAAGQTLENVTAWRSQKEFIMGEMLSSLRELAAAEKLGLAAHLGQTRGSMDRLFRNLTISSIVLILMGAALAFFVFQGFIAPLRERLRQTRAAMERQEKLSSLGVLAAGVAHEIRNPLTSIKARLFTQKSLLEEKSEAWEDNEFITEEISRLEKIVRDFLAFARPSEPHLARMKATQPFRDLQSLVRRSLEKANIALKEDFQTEAPIEADAQQIKQVLLNLVQNAAESIGRDGTITLRTRAEARNRMRQQQRMVVMEVEDNGKGLSPEVQKRLFDPFFTTKANGTGLGLSIAARILEKHRGNLEYEGLRDRGAVFRVVLPLLQNHDRNEDPAGG